MTKLLPQEENLVGLATLNRESIARQKLSISRRVLYWTALRVRSTASRSRRPTTVYFESNAITR